MRATYPTSRGLCAGVPAILQCVALAGLGVGSNACVALAGLGVGNNAGFGVIAVAIAGREATGV